MKQGDAHCYRCGYVWRPRRSHPRICARCKSPYFEWPRLRVPTFGGGLGVEEVLGPHRAGILRLARRHGATNVRVFGSVARRQATVSSDVDLLVDPVAGGTVDRLELGLALTRLLGRRADVVEERAVFWLLQPQVVAEAVPV